VNGIKLEFYSNSLTNSKEIQTIDPIEKIRPADILSLGAMKLEVMSRRNIFRDYYDIYSILQEGVSLEDIISRCGRYSKHRMKSKHILAILADHDRFRYEEDFQLMEPRYDVSSREIGEFLRQNIAKEFGR
jgi:hypothetical protein